MAIGTVGTAPVQNVNQTSRPAPSAGTTPAQFASQAADRTLGPATGTGAVQANAGGAPSGSAVADWAKKQEGNTVGRGECYDLADEALKQNGMKTASDYGKITPNGDYKWGKQVPLNESKAGDILQFRNYDNKTTQKDGAWEENDRPHHTAVVIGNDGKGNITVLEQNAPEGSPVTQRVLHFGNGKTQDENGNETTQKTTGVTKAYRPEPK